MKTGLLLLSLLAAAGVASAASPRQLSVRLFKHDEIVVIELTNTSNTALEITQLEPAFGVLHLYVYDPVRKDLQQAFATSFANPKGPKRAVPMIQPGETRRLQLTTEKVEQYYFRIPRCYYLVANYRDKRNGVVIASTTSNAIQICTPRPNG